MRFEDLQVWKRSARLSTEIYRYFAECRDFGFRDQITRSGLSIPCNIAEGHERGWTKDRARFWNYAKGSAGELRTQIYIAREIEYLDPDTASRWLREVREISRMIQSLISGIRHGE